MSKRKIAQAKEIVRKYGYRSGVYYGIDAQTAGTELGRMIERDGHLTAQSVVDEARPEHAPLHPAFEWDDATAAEGYRRDQARNLIRAVVVMPSDEDQRPTNVFVRVSGAADPDTPSGYYPTSVVVQRPDLAALALADLNRHIESAAQSAQQLRDAVEQHNPEMLAKVSRISGAINEARAAMAS